MDEKSLFPDEAPQKKCPNCGHEFMKHHQEVVFGIPGYLAYYYCVECGCQIPTRWFGPWPRPVSYDHYEKKWDKNKSTTVFSFSGGKYTAR